MLSWWPEFFDGGSQMSSILIPKQPGSLLPSPVSEGGGVDNDGGDVPDRWPRLHARFLFYTEYWQYSGHVNLAYVYDCMYMIYLEYWKLENPPYCITQLRLCILNLQGLSFLRTKSVNRIVAIKWLSCGMKVQVRQHNGDVCWNQTTASVDSKHYYY